MKKICLGVMILSVLFFGFFVGRNFDRQKSEKIQLLSEQSVESVVTSEFEETTETTETTGSTGTKIDLTTGPERIASEEVSSEVEERLTALGFDLSQIHKIFTTKGVSK